MTWSKLIAIALLALSASAQAFPWPHGARAAIALTYDDALQSQLRYAVPQLDAAGLKGTFFLKANTLPAADVDKWRKVRAAGHELGNHSLYHPCPAAAYPADPFYDAERYTPATMLREIGIMNAFLYAIDGRQGRAYSVPCSQMLVGGQDYTEPLRASKLIRYVRTGGMGEGIIADPAGVDPMRVPSRSFTEKNTGADLIGYADSVLRSGGMGVYMFHGVGGDYIDVSAEAHQALVNYLAEHRRDIWVAPFSEVMDWVMAHRGGAAQAARSLSKTAIHRR